MECHSAFGGLVKDFFQFVADVWCCVWAQVFCRVRPLDNDNDAACVKVLSASTVQLSQPEVCCFHLVHIISSNTAFHFES